MLAQALLGVIEEHIGFEDTPFVDSKAEAAQFFAHLPDVPGHAQLDFDLDLQHRLSCYCTLREAS